MIVNPLSSVIAADINGVDLGQPLDTGVINTLKQQWNQHLVLRFRGQQLTDDDLLRFSGYFGELDPPGPNPYGVTFLPDYPEINVISNVKDVQGTPIGNLGDGEAVWHADMTYIDNPPEAGILYALEVPASQGDTYFANIFFFSIPINFLTLERRQIFLYKHLRKYGTRYLSRHVFSVFLTAILKQFP